MYQRLVKYQAKIQSEMTPVKALTQTLLGVLFGFLCWIPAFYVLFSGYPILAFVIALSGHCIGLMYADPAIRYTRSSGQ